MDNTAPAVDSDAEQLSALGYTSRFDRTMSKWENFALGFTYLWSDLFVGVGQLLVCLVFGEVVSQFPISGGLYPWARRLVGKRWAWITGWIYAWALFATIAAVATGGAPFVAALIGVQLGAGAQTILAIAMIGMVTLCNLSGTRLLARVAMFGFICELVGAVLVGGYLLIFARHHSLSIIVDTSAVRDGSSYWLAFSGSAVAAM